MKSVSIIQSSFIRDDALKVYLRHGTTSSGIPIFDDNPQHGKFGYVYEEEVVTKVKTLKTFWMPSGPRASRNDGIHWERENHRE